VATLRSPEGCPWDREQTHASLRKNMIEEMYEVLETIDDDDPDAMCEELGDLMLQIVLHSQIEEEIGTFSVYDVINGLNEKLIRRHPHVFGNRSAANSDEALANWQEMKQQEKQRKGIEANRQSVLAGVPRGLPSLLKAWKIQKKAATVGFDWERVEDVVAKVQEEVDELLVEIRRDNKVLQREEFGDLLFATVNLSRFLQIDPEEALALANVKFTKRFTYIEQQLRLKGQSLKDTSLQEMEQLWQMSKNVF
jgi:tetrapyrrole methylase family protein/MazG family protein